MSGDWINSTWDWIDDEESQFQQGLAQQQAINQQAQQIQLQQAAAQQGSQSIPLGGTLQGASGTLTVDSSGSGRGQAFSGYSFSYSTTKKRYENKDASRFLEGLYYFYSYMVKEIVVAESLYKQILAHMEWLDKPEYEQQLTYHAPYGPVLIKNEKFQFNLDKYIEEGPAKEI